MGDGAHRRIGCPRSSDERRTKAAAVSSGGDGGHGGSHAGANDVVATCLLRPFARSDCPHVGDRIGELVGALEPDREQPVAGLALLARRRAGCLLLARGARGAAG